VGERWSRRGLGAGWAGRATDDEGRLHDDVPGGGSSLVQPLGGGFDLNPQVVEAIKSGQVQWTIDQQPYVQGFLAIDSLWLYLTNGNTVGGGKEVLTGSAFVSKDNIDQVAKYAEGGTR
jgi:ABC-type sugar transport system substrate-binding protein